MSIYSFLYSANKYYTYRAHISLLPTVSTFRSALPSAIIKSFSRLVVRQVSPQVADGVAYKILSRGRLTVPRAVCSMQRTGWNEY